MKREILEKPKEVLLENESSWCHALLLNDKSEDLQRMFRLFSRLETNSIPWPILFRVLSQKRDKIPLTAAKPGLKTVKRSRITTPSLSSWQERLFGEFTLSKGVEGCFCKIDMYLSIVATVAENDGVRHGVACWPPIIMVVMLADSLSWSNANCLLSTSVILQLEARAGSEWMN